MVEDNASGGQADSQAAGREVAPKVKSNIRSGERVIPYDAQMELDQRELSAQAIIDAAEQEVSDEEINRELQEAANEEREIAINAQVFDPGDTDSDTQSGARTEGGEGSPDLELTGQTNA